MGSAIYQREIWGLAARDWAELQEPMMISVYDDVLRRLGPGNMQSLLDAGCGSGVFCTRAADNGWKVTGLDATPQLLDLARRRTSTVTFLEGDLEVLPLPSQSIDVVTGFNAYQYAADQRAALTEAHRVLSDTGRLVFVTWGDPAGSDATRHYERMIPFLPPRPADAPPVYAPWTKEDIGELVGSAGFVLQDYDVVQSPWLYRNADQAVRAMLSMGSAVRAASLVGLDIVTEATKDVVHDYLRADGRVLLTNEFVIVICTKRP